MLAYFGKIKEFSNIFSVTWNIFLSGLYLVYGILSILNDLLVSASNTF